MHPTPLILLSKGDSWIKGQKWFLSSSCFVALKLAISGVYCNAPLHAYLVST